MQMSACWYMCARVLNTSLVCQHARGWDVWQSKPENIVGRHNTRHLHVQHKGSKPRKIPACCVRVHISGRFSAPSFNQKPQYQQHFLTVTVFVWRAKERSQHQKRPNFIAQLPSLLPSSRYIFIKMNVRIWCCSAQEKVAQQLPRGITSDSEITAVPSVSLKQGFSVSLYQN